MLPPPACAATDEPAAASEAHALTLEEAKQRALGNSQALELAELLVQQRLHAVGAARADYLPKVAASLIYAHFDDVLGTIVTIPQRHVFRHTLPGETVAVPFLEQDQRYAVLTVAQPLTPLLKVRQGVKVARADEQIAKVQVELVHRQLAAGVEELYFGLLAAQRIRAVTQLAADTAAELAAAAGTSEARLDALRARQGAQEAARQVARLNLQLASLVGLPPCAALELTEPGPALVPVACAGDAAARVLAASAAVKTAQLQVEKARAALCAAKLAYVPDVNLVGFSVGQNAIPAIQSGFSGVAVIGTVNLFEGGKRWHVVHERQAQLGMACAKLREEEEEARRAAALAFEDYAAAGAALATAAELRALAGQAVGEARLPAQKKSAAEEAVKAEVEYLKAQLAQWTAGAKLRLAVGDE